MTHATDYDVISVKFVKMPACSRCNKTQSRLNEGLLCKDCFSKSAAVTSPNMPELPDNWISEPCSNLSGGELLQIVKQAIKPLQDQINMYISKVVKVEDKCNIAEAKIEQLQEDVSEKAVMINKQSEDIESLKKIVLAQQIFCEKTQRNNLAKNLIITGISTENFSYDDQELVTHEEKLNAIFTDIGLSINPEHYELYAFPPGEGRNTHSIKITVNLALKKQILEKAKLLKETVFKGVFIKTDEPKMTRDENYRLRKKSRELKAQFPNSEIKLAKGILTQDGVKIDKFDLINQIF